MIEQWLNEYAHNAPYLVIFGILLATGFGLPLPEDIPLVIGGYLCGEAAASPDYTHPVLWIMLPGVMIAIVGSDVMLYFLGRWKGPAVRGPRTQIDRALYRSAVQAELGSTSN
ncbi:MAG: hypothetical protein AAF085_12160, partial [Planctomycetota bacterium]